MSPSRSMSDAIAAFELGSGLSVTAVGVALSVIGFGAVCGVVVWAMGQYLPAMGTGRLSPTDFWTRALWSVVIMAGCAGIFAVGSPIAP